MLVSQSSWFHPTPIARSTSLVSSRGRGGGSTSLCRADVCKIPLWLGMAKCCSRFIPTSYVSFTHPVKTILYFFVSFCIPDPYYQKFWAVKNSQNQKIPVFPALLASKWSLRLLFFNSFGSAEEWGNQEKLCDTWVAQQALNCRSRVSSHEVSSILTSLRSCSLHCESIMHQLMWLFKKSSNYSEYCHICVQWRKL